MLRMVLQRLMLGVITLGLVSLIIFAAMELLPGDACTALLKQDAQGQRLLNCQHELGLDRPAYQRYVRWAAGALQGDLGQSAHSNKPISSIVADRLKNSLLLGATALAVGLPLAFAAGILAALRRDKALDLVLSSLGFGFVARCGR